jgi:CRP/FNR family transcriptional regulator
MIITEKLQKLPLFKMLESCEIERLANISRLKTLTKDNILFYEGDAPHYFYLLLEGHLKLYKTDLKGNEIVIHYFTQASFIAERASLENIKFPATAIAMSKEAEVLLIDQKKFLKILQEDARFSFHLIKSITLKVKHLELVINRNMVYDAMTKVCSFIDENPNYVVTAKNKEVANFLNMAPETLSRILSKLRKLEIIDKKNVVLNKEKLKTMLEV